MSKRRSLTFLETMTGTVIATIRAAAPTGWLLFNGDTFGSATSGATRASADHQELFLVLWASLTNTDAPVSGGRGATAAADWAANKTITLPDMRGRSIIGTGTGSGLSARTHGAKVGAEEHTLTESQMPLHGHAYRASVASSGSSDATTATTGGFPTKLTGLTTQAAFTGTPSNTAGQQIGGTGGSAAHNNMQPSMALNWIVKI
jgi:microcystin-dependent protein